MKRLLQVAILCALLGLFAGILASCGLAASFAVIGTGDVIWANWQPLGMPPQKPNAIVAVSTGRYTQTGSAVATDIIVAHDNEYYTCCDTDTGTWQRPTLSSRSKLRDWDWVPTRQIYSGYFISDYWLGEYHQGSGALVLNAPPNAVDSAVGLEECTDLGNCSAQANWVIRADGSVWTFDSRKANHQGNYYEKGHGIWLSQVAWLVGAIVGLIIGVVLAKSEREKTPGITSTPSNQSK